jgi:ribosome biogenesis GTPase / thiamine phosphate phosphatase
MPLARVIRSTGSWYFLETEDGRSVEGRLKGRLRTQGLKATNPVAVGDMVDIEFESDPGLCLITAIRPRRNYIVRRATKLSHRLHIIAANIDTAWLVASISRPGTSTGFIDRFLITAEAYHIPACIIFNKSDLNGEAELKRLQWLEEIYATAGYPCFCVSALTGQGVPELTERLKDKVNLFSGHSGVGKSELINRIVPGLNLKTAPLSDYYGKGIHTTTFAGMHRLQNGGYIIDTPGIREFGLRNFNREELTHYFPEMFRLLPECRFYNCTHTNEPGCAVISALDKGTVSRERYRNYLNIINGEEMEETDWE